MHSQSHLRFWSGAGLEQGYFFEAQEIMLVGMLRAEVLLPEDS